MMTSSGSGSYRVGGSLSSSNLSPLAPPFKVEKSLPKPNSTNPSGNFSDMPVYGACFDPTPGQFWNSSSSSTSKPKCATTESVVTLTNCPPSPNIYGYRDSQSITSPASGYYRSTKAVSAYDPFSYEPFPSRMATNIDDAAKPYYPSYVSPPPQKDGYLGLGAGNVSGHDLLSYSGSSHLSGTVSAQVDHPQAMSSDGANKSKWGFVWNGLNDSEHGKWMDYTQGFVSKDLNTSNLSSNRNPLFVDGSSKSRPFVDINTHPFVDGSNTNHFFGDVSNKSHLKQGACLTQDSDLRGQFSSAKDNCFDIFGGGYSLGSLGLDRPDCKSFSECSRMRTSASATKSPHLQEPVLESVTSFCSSQKENGSLPENHLSQPGFYGFSSASTTSTFPVTITKLPYGGSSSSVESTPSAVKLNPKGIDASKHSNIVTGYNSSYQMEPQVPYGYKRQSSIRIRRPVPSSKAASSFLVGETADSRLNENIASENAKTSSELPYHLSVDGLNMEVSHAETVHSVEKYSGGSDVHNPAEDSPCWKGASSNQFSPFGYSESVASDVLVDKIDRCRGLNSQDLHNKCLPLNTSAFKDFSCEKVNKATFLDRPSVSDCISNDNEDCGSVNPKSCCFDLNAADSFQFVDDSHASKVECNTINKSKACLNSKFVLAAELKGDTSSARIISEPPFEKIRKGTSVASENLSGLPSVIGNNPSKSPPRNKASSNIVSEDSDSKINANVLLRTMMNLSEIFRCYCFSNRAEDLEKQSVVIKQIMNNLNASMLMMMGQKMPTSVLSTPDSVLQNDVPVSQMVNDAEELAASLKLGRTSEDSLDDVSVDANMTEAVKKLLLENLQEDENDQQKLFYKNLWLEAEASLCLMTAKARFLRMEPEMKRTYDGTKGDNQPSSNVSMNIHGAVELATEEYPKTTTTSQHNHMEQFHAPIPKVASLYMSDFENPRSTQKDSCFPSFFASSTGAFGNDLKLATEDKESPSLGNSPNPATTSQHNNIEVSHIPISQVASFYLPELERSKSMTKETWFPSLHPSSLGASTNDIDNSRTTNHTNDVETCVMARYQILKGRVGEHNYSDTSVTVTKLTDLESGSVFGGYQILNCRDDNFDHLNSEGQQFPGDENYLPDNGALNPDKAFQDSQMSNSLGVTDDQEASVMARFRIIQSRMDHSNSLINDSAPGQESAVVAEDENVNLGMFQQNPNIKKTTFGPYPELTEDEDVDIFNVGVNEKTFAPIVKNSVILEGWYENHDCSSSADWEHISSRDV